MVFIIANKLRVGENRARELELNPRDQSQVTIIIRPEQLRGRWIATSDDVHWAADSDGFDWDAETAIAQARRGVI